MSNSVIIIIFLTICLIATVMVSIVTVSNLKDIIKDQKDHIEWYEDFTKKVRETNEMAVTIIKDSSRVRENYSDAIQYATRFLKPRKKLRMLRIANGKEPLY